MSVPDPFGKIQIRLGSTSIWLWIETWRQTELTNVTAKMIIYQAFIEGDLDIPRHLARRVHDLYFEPGLDDFRARTLWSLSNAFTSAFPSSAKGYQPEMPGRVHSIRSLPAPEP